MGGFPLRKIGRAIGDFLKGADMVLLLLCIVTTIFGIVIISSATESEGSARYVMVQSFALVLGILIYVVLTLVDVDIIAERREILLIFSLLFIGCLKFWGISGETGNRSWLDIPLLPMNVQPGEVCKIFFIIILAKSMSVSQNRLSSPITIGKLGLLTAVFFLEIVYVSSDAGVALLYVLIFVIMAFVGGVNIIWFLMAGGALVIGAPILLALMREDQYNRIMMIFDPSIDPTGQGVRWQTNLSLQAITNGGLAGQGLYNGTMVRSSSIPAQHTDFIFSAIAEELGILGCVAVLLLLTAIVVRCLHVGVKSGNFMNRIICVGIAGMLLFQIIINVGMCLGVLPVIGLTLPFVSYGGTSVFTMFMAMGIVSGIHMRPAPDANARYIRPRSAA